VTLDALGQSASERFEIAGMVRQDLDQTGLGWLTCEALVNDAIAGSIPHGDTKRRIMGQSIDIVLSGTSDAHCENTFPDQFADLVSNPIGPTGIMNVLGNRIEQPESMLDLAKQDHTGIGRDSMIGRLNLDRAIELGLKKVILVFTHRVILLTFDLVVVNR